MIYAKPCTIDPKRLAVANAYNLSEEESLAVLLPVAQVTSAQHEQIAATASNLINRVRTQRRRPNPLENFLLEYDLTSDEGVALMCMAEALLRIPDKSTIDRLIRDKLTSADWQSHLQQSGSLAVNLTTWLLLFTGRVLNTEQRRDKSISITNSIKRLVARSSEPMIRKGIAQAMKILGRQFVMGRTIVAAVQRAITKEQKGYRYSYDMLGEAAKTKTDAERYFQAYLAAINSLAGINNGKSPADAPGISIKLSALHPRYELAQAASVQQELVPKLFALVMCAKQHNVAVTIDAEEADRLELSLDIFEAIFSDPSLDEWEGLGLAVQSYQKRAWYVLDWLADLSNRAKRRINVRLIKGAYWDSEIKRAQQLGVAEYPVFTRKYATDVSFIACAKKILSQPQHFYPQFATHNAQTIATILTLVDEKTAFEFQCLHGMGGELYDQIVGFHERRIACRIYAPVGSHEDLLPYLVRRLLENGANSSFVNRMADKTEPIENLIADPAIVVAGYAQKQHPKIPTPVNLYGGQRRNSRGIDLSDRLVLLDLQQQLAQAQAQRWQAVSLIAGKPVLHQEDDILSPSNVTRVVGKVYCAKLPDVTNAVTAASAAYAEWNKTPLATRQTIIKKAATLIEQHSAEFIYLAVAEAGKTLPDAVAELREAVDFCYYYCMQAERSLTVIADLPGYTGEYNQLEYHGRGVAACISPWNFPLAIFIGQVVAALICGNTVIAKPAEQTPLIAAHAVRLLHQAGIPITVLQLLPGSGEEIGQALVADPRIAAVMFTGSNAAAKQIQRTLATEHTAIRPLIAETGGINVMIVDSSALTEQVVSDVITSAFGSAGQRCSACRVIYLQDEIFDKTLLMLQGAMTELVIGDPGLLVTDIGPIIDAAALQGLQHYVQQCQTRGYPLYQLSLPSTCNSGHYFAPCLIEIPTIRELNREVFGPVLHVVRYQSSQMQEVVADINALGYGLTMGIHSRINETIDAIREQARVGNCYVNRNMIGAVVGVQPFGGEGLSGTGPKAGGPNYLHALCVERTLTINTTAAGGNATLMSLDR